MFETDLSANNPSPESDGIALALGAWDRTKLGGWETSVFPADENETHTTRIEYYLNQGMTEDEAQYALINRQTTFSLKICIEKYGKEEGKRIWEDRQSKWMKTLDELPEEEKRRIYDAKISALSMKFSKISLELFEKLNIKCAFYGENESIIKTENGSFKPDFLYGNKIIEFYGDFWHANPRKFNLDDIMKFPSRTNKASMIASDIRKKDEFKNKEFNKLGFDVLIVWESDYRLNPKREERRCLEFINGT